MEEMALAQSFRVYWGFTTCKAYLDNTKQNNRKKLWLHEGNSKIQNQKGIQESLAVSRIVNDNGHPL